METVELGAQHKAAKRKFTCGDATLDRYLRLHAGQHGRKDVARTRVTVDEHGAILGYYSLSTSSIDAGELPEHVRRRYPRFSQLPAALLARLAVASSHQGQGLGELLLIDAISHTVAAAEHTAIAFMILDAKSERVAGFYARYGFAPTPQAPLKLFLPMSTLREIDEETRAARRTSQD